MQTQHPPHLRRSFLTHRDNTPRNADGDAQPPYILAYHDPPEGLLPRSASLGVLPYKLDYGTIARQASGR